MVTKDNKKKHFYGSVRKTAIYCTKLKCSSIEFILLLKGDWIHDQRQGHGEMQFADGSLYDVRY
jgi:hypothetical protein